MAATARPFVLDTAAWGCFGERKPKTQSAIALGDAVWALKKLLPMLQAEGGKLRELSGVDDLRALCAEVTEAIVSAGSQTPPPPRATRPRRPLTILTDSFPEAEGTILDFCGSTELAALSATCRHYHGPCGSSPVRSAVLRAAKSRFPCVSVAAALGRRSWSALLHYAETIDARARGWSVPRLKHVLDRRPPDQAATELAAISLAAFTRFGGNPELWFKASCMWQILASNGRTSSLLLVSSNAHRAMVFGLNALGGSEPARASKAKAAEALWELSCEAEIAEAIVAADAIDPLVRLLCDGSHLGKSMAAGALGSLCFGNESHKDLVSRAGAVLPAVALLEAGASSLARRRRSELKETAAYLLRNLCSPENPKNAIAIVSAGAVAPLVAMLVEGDPDIKLEAACALESLACSKHPENLSAIWGAGAIEPLVSLLVGGGSDAQASVAFALTNLAFSVDDDARQLAIAKAGAIDPLVGMLGDSSQRLRDAGAAALCNLSGCGENKCEIAMAGGIEALVALMRESEASDSSMTSAACALENLAIDNPTNKAAIQAAGVPDLLRVLLRDATLPTSTTEVIESAIAALRVERPAD